MRTLNVQPEIANKFMLALNYEPRLSQPVMISMPKLNGVRAIYFPGKGWFSRDGVEYAPAVLAHIELPNANLPVDGELYHQGWPLQRINAAVGVNLDQPVVDTGFVKFHAFDLLSMLPAIHRMAKLPIHLEGSRFVEMISWKLIASERFDEHLDSYIREGYEGQMLKAPYERYRGGRDKRLMKRKDWKWIDVEILGVYEGEGELVGMLGGMVVGGVVDNKHIQFKVGCGKGLDHTRRIEYWRKPELIIGQKKKVRYLNFSVDGLFLNATIML